MANDDNENGYHGYRFLLDATNSRQYAVRYEHGKVKTPLHAFAGNVEDGGFKANEVVFAFDDEIQTKIGPNGKATASTVAYQITTDETGRPRNLKQIGVEFDITFDITDTSAQVKYTMTQESVRRLNDPNNTFESNFPRTFTDSLNPQDPGINRTGAVPTVSPSVINQLPFPPHHDGEAFIARLNIDKSQGTNTNTFNTAANPAIPEPPKNPKITDAQLEQALREYTTDLTEVDKNGKADPVVGRDEEIKSALRVLSRRKKANLAFTGEAGVGKTAMFAGIAHTINEGGEAVPDTLKNARVLQLDIQKMLAGAKFKGQFEERLKPVIDGLQEREGWFKGRKIILAIDEIHNQLGAGKNADDSSSAGNIMKPFLVSRGTSVMGTTTGDEYRKYIEKDSALQRRFQEMVLDPPDRDATLFIVKKLWPGIKSHHGLTEDIPARDLEYIVDMTNRYAPSESQPSKAESALDDAAANAKQRHSNKIERQDIVAAVAQMSKLSADFLSQNDADRFLKMETELPNEVLGQPGVQRVVDGLIGSRSGLADPNQPWASFVFQGPTGTGKTELAKALSRYLFGTEEALIQLNMADYSEKHTVSRLIGAPPGYVGFEDSEPALTERIKRRPYSILLLDEIEKAHPDVFNVLLPVLNDGKMTDNHGKKILFNNVIVIMTTNLGAKEAMAYLNGGGTGEIGLDSGNTAIDSSPEQQEQALSGIYSRERKKFFRPELINRIEELGGFITFIPLAAEVIDKLVHREVEKVNKRLSDPTGAVALNPALKDVVIEVSADAKVQLSAEGYKPDMGARPLRKVVREKISNPLGKWLMANKEKIADFVKENGSAKIVIDQLPGKDIPFEPRLVAGSAQPVQVATNDNAAQPAAATKRKRHSLKP